MTGAVPVRSTKEYIITRTTTGNIQHYLSTIVIILKDDSMYVGAKSNSVVDVINSRLDEVVVNTCGEINASSL